MSRPRVGVNLLWMIPGVVGGSETYTVRLLNALVDRGEHDLVLFVRPDFSEHHTDLAEAGQIVESPTGRTGRGGRVMLEHTWLRWVSARAGLDLIHHPGGTLPVAGIGPTVLTVHDLQPLTDPERFSGVKARYMAVALPRSIRAADKVTVTSQYVADEIARRIADPPGGVTVVTAGPGDVGSRPSADELAAARDAYGIGERYVLYPAISYGHKNHVVLLRAASQLPGVQIVFTGGPGDAEHEIRRFVADNDLAGRVKLLGRVPEEDLNRLLWGAAALVFPSLHEGFGLPVAEAMARDVPVIVADSTCLPSVAGEAGAVLPPHDVAGWAAAIQAVATDEDLAGRMVRAGRVRVREFSSTEGGRVLAAAYAEVLAR